MTRISMVSNPPELLAALDKLILALKSTGKMGPADFFSKKSVELQAAVTADAAIQELSTCSAIAQYGDFTFSEERLLEEVVEAAIRSRN
ncbi:hypothetical protein [Pseudomonas syringae group sp. J309-1]|uniref:hypothetical protein n=1 Tax=Pseudomonas syringae group sp. J309-1 TaxID=3079588 RepID=UPI00290CFE69|nr:hypothetical protein [Pseudomonas syringae group sp. J309-1]MDU8360014.1 hypothetical protein [Pseudomonas syringae group sp. J309-1]